MTNERGGHMEEMRQQFESWVNRRPLSKLIGFCERDGDGYAHLQHTALWESWKASRSTPPVAYMTHHGSAVSSDDFADGEEEMHHAAKSEGWAPLVVGITVKGEGDA